MVNYYTMHETNQADYNCLVEPSKYKKLSNPSDPTDPTAEIITAQETAYYKALARERYALKETDY